MSDIKFTSHKDEILSEYGSALNLALNAIGMTAEGHAKKVITDEHRVDTGRMRNSVGNAVKDNAVYIGSNVEYAPYNELGTSKMSGIHFLQRAATEHTAEYKALAEDAFKSLK